jgi:group I intron endonuclease
MTCGVYVITCLVTGRVYIGGSIDIEKRRSWHSTMLKQGRHTSPELLKGYLEYGSKAFTFSTLEECSEGELRSLEQKWMDTYSHKLLNSDKTSTGRGRKIPKKAREKISEAQKRIALDPEERKRRSERAKAQHAAGRLGRSTWAPGQKPTETEKVKEGRKRTGEILKAHIAAQTPDEMSRRSYQRKLFK